MTLLFVLLTAVISADDSLHFLIKGRKFSIDGLLGKEVSSPAFVHGSLVIFRLAPQDYHRLQAPTSGRIEQYVDIPGCLYTIARVAVGSTMVGSITVTKKKGHDVQKGDELRYFTFGGSTVIYVFEKDAIDLDEDLLANSARSL